VLYSPRDSLHCRFLLDHWWQRPLRRPTVLFYPLVPGQSRYS